MKNNIKIVIAFILGAIISSGITAVVALNVSANDISYENGTVKDALDNLYDIEGTQVATLTTQGATYTMQNDGYITGTAAASNSKNAIVYINNTSTNYILAPYNTSSEYPVSLYFPKNTVITTRSDGGIYNLTVYEWK